MSIRLSTIALELGSFDLINRLPNNPMAHIRGGQGLVGWGEALRIEARGENRIQELATKWRELATTAVVDDQVNLPGSGLVAFGSIAFADNSSATSVLIVPKVLLGVRDGRAWLTTVEADGNTASIDDVGEFWLSDAGYCANTPVQFGSGSQTAEGFKRSVEDAVAAISRGELKKVVLARDLVGSMPKGFDIRSSLAKLAGRFPTCWVYSVDGLFGASPELLVRVAHGQVSARVLAGTAGRGTDPGSACRIR